MLRWQVGLLITFIAVSAVAAGPAAAVEPLAPKVPAAMADNCELLSPSAVHIDGWLGARIDANVNKRLLVVDTEPLLAGYHKRPGSHPWIGEHIGKWMHAATLAWAYSGDQRLREKLDRVAAELIPCQEPDGYLGTYAPGAAVRSVSGRRLGRLVLQIQPHRPADLLPVYGRPGGPGGLPQDGRPADRHVSRQEEHSGGGDPHGHGRHERVGAGRVALPGYRRPRYLKFARYIVQSWDEPSGPKIVASAPDQRAGRQDGQRQGL